MDTKKLLSIGAMVFCFYTVHAQNIFPSGGNTGIGISNPESLLHITTYGTAAYPSKTSRGNIMQLFQADNNDLEIGVGKGVNTRKAWILARHLSIPEYGEHYSTLHLQPQIDVMGFYRGVAIGYLPSSDVPYGVGLAVAGNVGIGTTTPLAKLSVNGNILATEIKIKTNIEVPDYVFDPSYELPKLSSIENYVKKYRHLPEIPSAVEIQKDGLDLALMNLSLLKKVEELTLHLIEKEKQLMKQDQRITEIENSLNKINDNK
ncbi:hypothetical protein GEO21_15880 [Sphingobacterium faecium]|uniref:hypothetical protein n=1 Tax=Sphingobacterium faecium TaxID=34087 RepID=UPI0012923B86|nr:hypothetical protein [Sphingobacterium faecium]MQP28981.1 hypothetical protein [Sphingobacterium faecium]